MGTSFSIENKVPSSPIGDSHDSLLNFLLYSYGYSSDISKCYLRILVDELTGDLRLMIWYRDPKNKLEPIVYRRYTMDFGDACSALVVRIAQKKLLCPRARLASTKHTILAGGYADNYSNSFPTKQEYMEVSKDMEEIHAVIGLPLKATYTSIQTDPQSSRN